MPLTRRHPGLNELWAHFTPRGFIRQDSLSSQTGRLAPLHRTSPCRPVIFLSGLVVVAQFHQENWRLRPRLPSSATCALTTFPQLVSLDRVDFGAEDWVVRDPRCSCFWS